jgi:hypothetical protein
MSDRQASGFQQQDAGVIIGTHDLQAARRFYEQGAVCDAQDGLAHLFSDMA